MSAAIDQFRTRAARKALESGMGHGSPSSQARLLGSLVNDGRRGPQRLLVALQLILRNFLHDQQLVRRLVLQLSEARRQQYVVIC